MVREIKKSEEQELLESYLNLHEGKGYALQCLDFPKKIAQKEEANENLYFNI